MINRVQEFVKLKEERKEKIRGEIISFENQLQELEDNRGKVITEIAALEVKNSSENNLTVANENLREIGSKIVELKTNIEIKKEVIKNIDKQKLNIDDSALLEEMNSMKINFNIKEGANNILNLIGNIKNDVNLIRDKVSKLDRISSYITAKEGHLTEELKEVTNALFKELSMYGIREIDKFTIESIRNEYNKLDGIRIELADIGKPINLRKRLGL